MLFIKGIEELCIFEYLPSVADFSAHILAQELELRKEKLLKLEALLGLGKALYIFGKMNILYGCFFAEELVSGYQVF